MEWCGSSSGGNLNNYLTIAIEYVSGKKGFREGEGDIYSPSYLNLKKELEICISIQIRLF